MSGLRFEVNEGIGTITFDRPDALNALNQEVLEEFSRVVKELPSHKDVSIVILQGEGERSFIAGADIKAMESMTPLDAAEFATLGQGVLLRLEQLPQVTIAAVNGFALGGGCEVAMACDLIYASEDARFGQPEVNLGIIPGFGGTQRLPRIVGSMRAREMIYTGRNVTAEEALKMGLVAQVFPKEQLKERVIVVAKSIMSKGPEAIRQARASIREGMDTDLARACAIERDHFALCFTHPDQKEGMEAFVQKRKPVWKR